MPTEWRHFHNRNILTINQKSIHKISHLHNNSYICHSNFSILKQKVQKCGRISNLANGRAKLKAHLHCVSTDGNGFGRCSICSISSFYSGGMSASGDFAVPKSYPRKRDPGTGTKNNIVTNRQLSVMRIQINKNPSMTAQQLHNKCVNLHNFGVRLG